MKPGKNALVMNTKPKKLHLDWSTPQTKLGALSVTPLETQLRLFGEWMVFGVELSQENAHTPSMPVNDKSSEIHLTIYQSIHIIL